MQMLGVLVRVLRVFSGVHDLRHKGVAEESHREQEKAVGEGERQRILENIISGTSRSTLSFVVGKSAAQACRPAPTCVPEGVRFFLARRWAIILLSCFVFLFLRNSGFNSSFR